MTDFAHGTLQANGIELHYVEAGTGPLVLFCHGFPESWYSWRYQLPAVAQAGFRAVALDMRGYGGTSKPEAIDAYGLDALVGDVVGAVAALGETTAVVVGHDWGGPVAWYSALMRPDVFRAVAVCSVPYTPPLPLPPNAKLSALMAANAGERVYYRLYFQEPGVAEKELEADVRTSVLGSLYGLSGDVVRDGVLSALSDGHFDPGEGFLSLGRVPETLPAWLTEEDVDFYTKELTASGFRGGLNWYRNIDRLPTILAPHIGRTIEQPSLYLYGSLDLLAGNSPEALALTKASLPNLTKMVCMEGAGHWLQQERAADVNRELLAFLAAL